MPAFATASAVADPATTKATPSVDREADLSSDDEGLETENEEVTAQKKSKRGIALLRGMNRILLIMLADQSLCLFRALSC